MYPIVIDVIIILLDVLGVVQQWVTFQITIRARNARTRTALTAMLTTISARHVTSITV